MDSKDAGVSDVDIVEAVVDTEAVEDCVGIEEDASVEVSV